MRNAIGLAFAIATAALVGVDNHSGLAQEKAKMKLAPPQVFQPPFPYSLGIVAQGKRTVYVAGQVALDKLSNLVGKDDFRLQIQQVFENLKAAVEAAGGDFGDVIKLNGYFLDLSHLAEFREVRDKYINLKNPPASTAVQVSELFRPEYGLPDIERRAQQLVAAWRAARGPG